MIINEPHQRQSAVTPNRTSSFLFKAAIAYMIVAVAVLAAMVVAERRGNKKLERSRQQTDQSRWFELWGEPEQANPYKAQN